MKKFLFIFYVCISTNVMADDYITQNIINGCGDIINYKAIFEPLISDCEVGTFLPAGALECSVCPTDFTCPGGLFLADDRKSQGLSDDSILSHDVNNACAMNFSQNFTAFFELAVYTCAPGYYLPADTEGCIICPVGSYCVGGRYTFNETTTQGIEPCPDGTISMAGAPACYPHILHIGDDIVYLKSEKLTTPSLNIGIDGEVFYANMTTEPTLMNSRSEHYLKLEYNNTIYHVCDDTTFAQ